MIRVVCGIIYNNDKVFICRRKPEKSLGGYWEFPGGKIENGESLKESLIRELNEELRMDVEEVKYFGYNTHNYNDLSIELIAYTCKLKEWNGYMSDHDQYQWLSPSDMSNLYLAPADKPLLEKLIQFKENE